jgi:hypothetical protein
MTKSPLFDYYSKNEADMLQRIYQDKKTNGYKITSKKMFKVEVDIMTDVIKYLNAKGIYVLYVYDALLCVGKDETLVIETMNRIILEHGVKTNVKSDGIVIERLPNSEAVEVVKYALDEMVNLYDVLPQLTFSVDDTIKIIYGIDCSNILMVELFQYFGKQIREKKYRDYDGVAITSDTIMKLKSMIKT